MQIDNKTSIGMEVSPHARDDNRSAAKGVFHEVK
jgi:hypothetical protein